MKIRIIRYFPNIHMANCHLGLAEIARKAKVHLEKLELGELVVFVNSEFTKIKVFGANGVYAYYRSPRGKLNAGMIKEIPKSFGGGRIDFDAALEKALNEQLK